MLKVLSAKAMREVDRLTTERFSTPAQILMEEAAGSALRAIAAEYQEGLQGKHARVLCGPGNNGGDGAALARKLSLGPVPMLCSSVERRKLAILPAQTSKWLSVFQTLMQGPTRNRLLLDLSNASLSLIGKIWRVRVTATTSS
jgi:NAD(P)H-hydrate repair Nnr-like enzyme with NAD(P)H-hydrate epimerase domain